MEVSSDLSKIILPYFNSVSSQNHFGGQMKLLIVLVKTCKIPDPPH